VAINNTFVQQKDQVIKNRTNYNNINFSISLSYQEDEKKSFEFRPNIGYNTTKSSIQPDVKYNYFTYGGQINGFVMLPGKLELSTEVNLNYQQKLPNFPANQNFTIWNASLARKVFQEKKRQIHFRCQRYSEPEPRLQPLHQHLLCAGRTLQPAGPLFPASF
jgi:hypothetical protein